MYQNLKNFFDNDYFEKHGQFMSDQKYLKMFERWALVIFASFLALGFLSGESLFVKMAFASIPAVWLIVNSINFDRAPELKIAACFSVIISVTGIIISAYMSMKCDFVISVNTLRTLCIFSVLSLIMQGYLYSKPCPSEYRRRGTGSKCASIHHVSLYFMTIMAVIFYIILGYEFAAATLICIGIILFLSYKSNVYFKKINKKMFFIKLRKFFLVEDEKY